MIDLATIKITKNCTFNLQENVFFVVLQAKSTNTAIACADTSVCVYAATPKHQKVK